MFKTRIPTTKNKYNYKFITILKKNVSIGTILDEFEAENI